MTTLESVNIIIAEALQEPPVTALDTGGTSIEGEAETWLDRVGKRIQGRGWVANTENEQELKIADTSMTFTGSTGTFLDSEIITGSVSTATGTFRYIEGSTIYLNGTSGTFQNGDTLTGSESSVTRVSDSAPTTLTESKIAFDKAGRLWLKASPSLTKGETACFVQNGSFLYDTTNRVYVFTTSVFADVVRLRTFTDLPESLATYIVYQTAYEFQRYKKRGQFDDAVLRNAAMTYRIKAEQEDSDTRGRNTMFTLEHTRFKGRRTLRRWP